MLGFICGRSKKQTPLEGKMEYKLTSPLAITAGTTYLAQSIWEVVSSKDIFALRSYKKILAR